MYRVDRNNFYKNEKEATVFTPDYVSEFLFSILHEQIPKDNGTIFDPCVGRGSLLRPWKRHGYAVQGIDIEFQGFPHTTVANYLTLEPEAIGPDVSLVIMNPPFNIDRKTKQYIKERYGGRPLLPEVWFSKALDLFGHDVPIVMFTPYGFRLNQTMESKRWLKFARQEYPPISSIISLPKNVFEGILFHSEILVFNIDMDHGHYFVSYEQE
jgi:type I restriction-modification system DNA methylase subunit